MTIDKAIRLLEWLLDSHLLQGLPLYGEAIKLGFEALKNLRNQRASGIAALDYRLLGETSDAKT
jgi:hypothetical protein